MTTMRTVAMTLLLLGLAAPAAGQDKDLGAGSGQQDAGMAPGASTGRRAPDPRMMENKGPRPAGSAGASGSAGSAGSTGASSPGKSAKGAKGGKSPAGAATPADPTKTPTPGPADPARNGVPSQTEKAKDTRRPSDPQNL